MTGGNNVNTKFYESVRVQMTRRELDRLTPWHRGLDIDYYAPIVDGVNLLHEPKYNKEKIDWADITLTGSTINPYPLKQRDQHDIEEELSMLDSKHKILQDHITSNENKELLHEIVPLKDILMIHSIPLDHPYLDGQNDYLKSKMTNIHEVEMTLAMVKYWEHYFERRKVFYGRSHYHQDAMKETYTRKSDGTKMVKMEIGDLP